jgi:hypothetical protein
VLRIIVQKPIERGTDNRLLKAIIPDRARKGDIFIYQCNDDANKIAPQHFVVTDAQAYRRETNDKKVLAVANFGDNDTAKYLQEVFKIFTTYLFAQKRMKRFAPGAAFEL